MCKYHNEFIKSKYFARIWDSFQIVMMLFYRSVTNKHKLYLPKGQENIFSASLPIKKKTKFIESEHCYVLKTWTNNKLSFLSEIIMLFEDVRNVSYTSIVCNVFSVYNTMCVGTYNIQGTSRWIYLEAKTGITRRIVRT